MDEDELATRLNNVIEELVTEHGYSRGDIDEIVDSAFVNAGKGEDG